MDSESDQEEEIIIENDEPESDVDTDTNVFELRSSTLDPFASERSSPASESTLETMTTTTTDILFRDDNNPFFINMDVEDIYFEEQDFLDSDKQTDQYYIGSVWSVRKTYYVMNKAITPKTFFKHHIKNVRRYLFEEDFLLRHEISSFWYIRRNIEIVKLHIHPITGEYTAILKTFWLRIIQRTWRKIFQKRREIYKKRGTIQNLQYRMIYGKHQYGLNVLPGLIGMM